MEENSTIQRPTVFSVGLKYGLFMGLASILFTVILVSFGINPFQDDWKKWISVAISIALVVLAHKEFKDKGDGYMSYGQGFGITFVAMGVSIIIGVIFSYIYISFIDTGAMEAVWQKMADDMEAKGQSQEIIDKAVGFTKKFFWGFYVIGGLFMAALIGLIIPIFTQKKNPDPSF